MKNFVTILIGFLSLLLICSVAIAQLFPELEEQPDVIEGNWSYRIIVTLNTPEGLKTKYAVRKTEVKLEKREGYKPYPYVSNENVYGEAVVIDLDGKKTIFAIMDQDGSYTDVKKAISIWPPMLTPPGVKYFSSLPVSLEGKLLREDWPQFVYFEDINDPRTIKTIEPEDIHEVLGEGVEVNAISIKITDEKVTNTIGELINKFGGSAGPYDRSRFQRKEDK